MKIFSSQTKASEDHIFTIFTVSYTNTIKCDTVNIVKKTIICTNIAQSVMATKKNNVAPIPKKPATSIAKTPATLRGKEQHPSQPKTVNKKETSVVNDELSTDHRYTEIQQLRDEYDKLSQIHENLHKDYQAVIALNTTLSTLVADLNKVIEVKSSQQVPRVSQPKHDTTQLEELVELRGKAEKLEKEKIKLESDLNSLKESKKKIEKDLEKLKDNERKIFATLEMDVNKTTTDEAIRKLLELMKSKTDTDTKNKPLYDEMSKIKHESKVLQEQNKILEREKNRFEFDIRNKDLMIKRLKHLCDIKPTIYQANSLVNESKELLKMAIIRSKNNGLPALLNDHSYPADNDDEEASNYKLCVTCHTVSTCEPEERKCRQHYKPFRKKWLCCENESHKSPGCITIPHCYIIKSNTSILLTDGLQFFLYE